MSRESMIVRFIGGMSSGDYDSFYDCLVEEFSTYDEIGQLFQELYESLEPIVGDQVVELILKMLDLYYEHFADTEVWPIGGEECTID